jgi:outer membrane receptor protein involved in Fe transport
LGYYRDAYRSLYYLNTDDAVATHVTQLFGHGEYRPWENVVFNLGAMLERAPLSDEWLLLPRLSAHWHLDDRQTLRAIYATGSRQPSIYENQGQAVIRGVNVPLTLYRVYATGIEQGGLAPERNRALELGYFWQPTPSINLDLRLFQERITDFITAYNRLETQYPTAAPGNTVIDFGNENPITVRGGEAQLHWRNRSGTRLFAGYAWLDADADSPRFEADYARSVPRRGASLLLSQELAEDWQASLAYTYQSAMHWYREAPIDAYHQLSGRIAKRLRWGKTQALAELIGGNLVEDVSDYLPNRAWDRGLYVRFSADY